MCQSAIGFRASARALEILAPLLPGQKFCSANGGQSWLLRLGLHELQRPKEQADDWAWMVDHTIQTGNGKCLVIVGVRLSAWQHKRAELLAEDPQAEVALCQSDLSVWALERVDSSNGAAVRDQLVRLSQETGVTPRCVLTDQGADVRNGAELFCEKRETVVVHDVAHAAANAVKRQLNNKPEWTDFLADANKSKTALRQTPYAFLIPPELKSKARWMNVDTLIRWGRRVQQFLEDPAEALRKAEAPCELEPLQEKMAWLDKHTGSLALWSAMLQVVAVVLSYVRSHGYHRQAATELERRLQGLDRGAPAQAVAQELLGFVRAQSEKAGAGRLIGSTEVLESLIGAGKQMQGRNKNGFTKTVLAMAAKVVRLSAEGIKAALAAVKVKDVTDWVAENIGLSLQAKRQRALPNQPRGTKPG